MTDSLTESKPARRVTLTLTAYLPSGVPVGGFYDLQSAPDERGMQWSIPQSVVDEASVCDAPPEALTPEDWEAIRGIVAARLGRRVGDPLAGRFRATAENRPDSVSAAERALDRARELVTRHAAHRYALFDEADRHAHPEKLIRKDVLEEARAEFAHALSFLADEEAGD